jgi:hypothetical protein
MSTNRTRRKSKNETHTTITIGAPSRKKKIFRLVNKIDKDRPNVRSISSERMEELTRRMAALPTSDTPAEKSSILASESWYLIPEIPTKDFLICVTPIYSVIEETHISKTNEDPFIKAVLVGNTAMTDETWKKAEKSRLSQKALEMKMGDFHEELMGKFPGYKTLPNGHDTGCDVSSDDGNTLIEVKNKHNTIKGSDGKHVVEMLKKHADTGKNAILVQVNCPGGKVTRFGAHQSVKVWNGK